MLKLDNGQFALQPNNRTRFFDPAFNPQELKFPDFKVATRRHRVEQAAKWRLGDTVTFTYDDRGEAEPPAADPLRYASVPHGY